MAPSVRPPYYPGQAQYFGLGNGSDGKMPCALTFTGKQPSTPQWLDCSVVTAQVSGNTQPASCAGDGDGDGETD